MSPQEITAALVRQYLRTKGYHQTLDSFNVESTDSNPTIPHRLSLESIVEDRVNYISKYESKEDNTNAIASGNDLLENTHLYSNWKEKAIPAQWSSLNNDGALVIHLSASEFLIGEQTRNVLFVTLATKVLILIDLDRGEEITRLHAIHGNVLGKMCYALQGTNKFLSCDMNGTLILFELKHKGIQDFESISICELQIHKRLVIDFKIVHNPKDNSYLIASIGWDLNLTVTELAKIGSTFRLLPHTTTKLLSTPTAIDFSLYDGTPIILVTRIDSTRLSLYSTSLLEITRLALNTSQFSSNEFTAMSISLSKSELKDSLVGITTSHIPFGRVIIVRIPDLSPILTVNSNESFESTAFTPQDFHDVVVGNFNTLSPQDKYSTPQLQWTREDDVINGCWLPGDDGVVRGLKLKNGEVFEVHGKLGKNNAAGCVEVMIDGDKTQESVHGGRRIKCFVHHRCADGNEVFVSSGIDKKLVLWK